jgi:hypothetical protein
MIYRKKQQSGAAYGRPALLFEFLILRLYKVSLSINFLTRKATLR